MPKWQFCLTASDANRFVLRLARQITGRSKTVVHNWCYHGSVDETLAQLDMDGSLIARPGSIGPAADPTGTVAAPPLIRLPAGEASKTAPSTEASAQAINPCAVSRKYTSSLCTPIHRVRSRPARLVTVSHLGSDHA